MSSEGTCTDPYPPAPEEAQKTSVRVKSMFLFNSPTALYSLLSMKVLVHKVACFLITYRWRSIRVTWIYSMWQSTAPSLIILIWIWSRVKGSCSNETRRNSFHLVPWGCVFWPETISSNPHFQRSLVLSLWIGTKSPWRLCGCGHRAVALVYWREGSVRKQRWQGPFQCLSWFLNSHHTCQTQDQWDEARLFLSECRMCRWILVGS